MCFAPWARRKRVVFFFFFLFFLLLLLLLFLLRHARRFSHPTAWRSSGEGPLLHQSGPQSHFHGEVHKYSTSVGRPSDPVSWPLESPGLYIADRFLRGCGEDKMHFSSLPAGVDNLRVRISCWSYAICVSRTREEICCEWEFFWCFTTKIINLRTEIRNRILNILLHFYINAKRTFPVSVYLFYLRTCLVILRVLKPLPAPFSASLSFFLFVGTFRAL